MSAPVDFFMDEVADWLLLRHDNRLELKLDGSCAKIVDVCGACADFCGFMAELEEQGISIRNWREHMPVTN